LARRSEQGGRPLEQFIEETFNGAALQDIGRALADGIFPQYCLHSQSCPIVRKATAEHFQSLPPVPADEVGN